MTRRLLSILLAVLLLFTTAAIAFAADGDAAEEQPKRIYFDPASANWEDITYVRFHVWTIDDPDFVGFDWGGKKQNGTQAEDGTWYYDFDEKGLTIKTDCQYAVIFYNNKGQQTYNLLFDSTCFGDVAEADLENVLENPEDSSKTAVPAYWKHQDPTVNGPELKISSIGNVVGTCIPRSLTKAAMVTNFIDNTLENAREFSELTDQEIIDNIGTNLEMTREEIAEAIAAASVETEWNYDDSILPAAEEPTEEPTEEPATEEPATEEPTAEPETEEPTAEPEPVPDVNGIYFDPASANWDGIKYVRFHIWAIDDPDFVGFDWGAKKQAGKLQEDGTWYYDFGDAGLTIKPDCQYAVIFYNDKGEQTYNLLFDASCLGDTAYADPENLLENPEDSSKTAMPAYWKHQDPTVNGPELKISSIGNVVGSCIPRSLTKEEMVTNFINNTLENAREFSELTDQEMLDNIGAAMGMALDDMEFAVESATVETAWTAEDSTLPQEMPDIAPLRGDYDGDREITILDATRAQNIIAELTERPAEDFLINIDADGDYELTIMDATRIQRFLAELCDMDGNAINDGQVIVH